MQETQETWDLSLGQEDPLEEDLKWQTRSIILAWKIQWTGGAQQATLHGVAKSWTQLSDWAHTQHAHIVAFSPASTDNLSCRAPGRAATLFMVFVPTQVSIEVELPYILILTHYFLAV